MLKKEATLIGAEKGEAPPEPGYIKAKLTVGIQDDDSKYFGPNYGYKQGEFGALSPCSDYTEVYSYFGVKGPRTDRAYEVDVYYLVVTHPIYFKGVKYSSGYDYDDIFGDYFGQTVDIWIQG